MASLNIPFLVFSRSNFVFESDESCYATSQHIPEENEESLLIISDYCGEAIFFTLEVDYRTLMKKKTDSENACKSCKSFFHMLLHPKLLLVPSISMKEKIGKLLDACIVKSPAKFILSTSEYLWVTLHDDNVVRLWSISDGRCLMWSTKELFLTKLKKIYPIPTYDGYLLCFGEEGDLYIVNMFKMRLLKHSSIDIEGISHLSTSTVDNERIIFVITDDNGKVTEWETLSNKHATDIKSICNYEDLEIDFQLNQVLYQPEDDCTQYLLVFQDKIDANLVMVSKRNVTVK